MSHVKITGRITKLRILFRFFFAPSHEIGGKNKVVIGSLYEQISKK